MQKTVSAPRRFNPKSILLGSSALLAGLAISSGAQAQCVSTGSGAEYFAPFARGSSVSSLISVLNTSTSVFQAQTGSAFVSSPANPAPGENGGGVWGRALGGQVETKNTNSAVVNATLFVPGTGPGTGSATAAATVNCDTKTRQDFVGYQVGRDIAKLNWNGWNVHMGATAGYLTSQARDKTADVVPPTFNSVTEVPFMGSYLAVTRGGFFADAQVRWDFYNMSLNDTGNGLFNQQLNARGWSVAGGLGYNFSLPNNWFIEPSAGFTYSKVEVDPLNVTGTIFTTGFSLPGTVQIDDIKSELGRVSLRVGTNFTTQYAAVQPFITGSVFHEFAGDVTTRINSGLSFQGFDITANGVMTTSRIGTYGQISGGFAAQALNTGWLGYVRGDYRFGENIEGWALNAGLRYQFMPEVAPLPQVALSGKSPVFKAPPAPIVVPVSWQGLYVGVHAGTIWGKTTEDYLPNVASADIKYGGALLGGQAGYNFQWGPWVVGLEGDIAWSNAKGSVGNPLFGGQLGFFATDETNLAWFATVTGRLGYAWERTLFYVKGGAAMADVTQQTRSNFDGSIVWSASKIATGWTAGLGAEYALTSNWSAKAEWLYYDLGTDTYAVDYDAHLRGGLARVGVNYRFSPVPAPVMAKY
ncbi:MAG: autotransporter domain-containing protein [Rhodovulum sp.]|nr:autotransporter domain-containing protein [Rhodovulum sp.]